MNIVLWIVQGVLALLCLSGGAFKAFNPGDLAGQFHTLPPGAWRALGGFEVVGGVLLILPAALGWMPALTPLAAALIAIEALALGGLYGSHSLQLTAANPLVWSVAIGVMGAVVAYGRYSLQPIA